MKKYLTLILNVVFFLCFFPYLTPFKNPFDLQPWAFAGGVIFVCLFFWEKSKLKGGSDTASSLPKPLVTIAVLTFYAITVFIVSWFLGNSDFLLGSRVLFGYVSFLLFSFIGYQFFRHLSVKTFLASVILWLCAVLSQMIFGPHILDIFLSRLSTGGNRGLTAFASEPAFYAMMCAFFVVFNEVFFSKEKYSMNWYLFILIIAILQIDFSLSGVGLLCLLLLGIAKLWELVFIRENKKNKYLALVTLILVISAIGVFFLHPKLKETRAGQILQKTVSVSNSTGTPILQDHSVSFRLSNPVLGFYGGLVETRGLGFGIGSHESGLVPAWLAAFHGESRAWGGKIEGGLSGIIYELGLLGCVFTAIIFFVIMRSWVKSPIRRGAILASALVIFLPFCIFGSIAAPLFGLLFGVHLFFAYPKVESDQVAI